MIKIYEDENFYIRDDLANGIIIEEGITRYSVFYKKDHHRVVVLRYEAEKALNHFKANYNQYLQEAIEYNTK